MGKSTYLYNAARTIAGQIGLPKSFNRSHCLGMDLREGFEEKIKLTTKTWGSERKGKLAASYDAQKLDTLVLEALISAIADNIVADLAKEPRLATIEQDGYRAEVLRADFKAWQGVDFRILLTRLDCGQWVTHDFFLDKDDIFFVEAGICKRGGNFEIRDKEKIAALLLETLSISEYDPEEGHHHIYIADTVMLGDWIFEDLQLGFHDD